jgi:hypothetical protein
MPSWDLRQGGSASGGSCVTGCVKYSTRNIAGTCCGCKGRMGTYQRTPTAGVYRCSTAPVPVSGLGAPGVPSPFVAHQHPYPTRYHGGIWTRPEFSFPYVSSPFEVFMPRDFAGLGCGCSSPKSGVGDWNTEDGVFRDPREAGGGIFNAVSGVPSLRTTGTFALGALLGLAGILVMTKKR